MVEIISESGQINYEQALEDVRIFLYGKRGEIDIRIHSRDILFYMKPKNLVFILKSFSLSIIPQMLKIWVDLGFRPLHQYFQLNLTAVMNKLKEQAKRRRKKHD